MINVGIKGLAAKLAPIMDPIALSLLSNQRTEVKPNLWVELKGPLDFSISTQNNAIIVNLKGIQPIITTKVAFFEKSGNLTKIVITIKNVTLTLDGLPDICLESV